MSKLAFKDKIVYHLCYKGFVEEKVKCSKDDFRNVGVKVANSQFGLATADKCFDDEGQFIDKVLKQI